MIIAYAFIVGFFGLFIWLIFNSAEAKRGNHSKNKKKLYWIIGCSLILWVVIPMVLNGYQDELEPFVTKSFKEQYGQEFRQIQFLKRTGKITYYPATNEGPATSGRFLYKVVDLHGNNWEWVVDWAKYGEEIRILDAHEY